MLSLLSAANLVNSRFSLKKKKNIIIILVVAVYIFYLFIYLFDDCIFPWR